jgi:hypothetical protein
MNKMSLLYNSTQCDKHWTIGAEADNMLSLFAKDSWLQVCVALYHSLLELCTTSGGVAFTF